MEMKLGNKKYLDNFEVLCWRKMEISWTDHVRNEEILLKIQRGEKYPKKNNKKEGLVTSFIKTTFKDTLLKER
jgi:hypothetical protein